MSTHSPDDLIEELTSAEAGFLCAVRHCGGSENSHWNVDELAAGPLAEIDEWGLDAEDDDRDSKPLRKATFRGWWRRGAFGACEDRRRVLEWTRDQIEDQSSMLDTLVPRRLLRGMLTLMGGDLSPISSESIDLRPWATWNQRQHLETRLIVVGGVLVGRLRRASIHRRVASLLRRIPPAIQARINRGLDDVPPLDCEVERRVFEVYTRVADEGRRADEELAIIGLFFIICAHLFRQNAVVNRLEQMLPEKMVSPGRAFRRACLQSRKPELGVKVAQTIQPLIAQDQIQQANKPNRDREQSHG